MIEASVASSERGVEVNGKVSARIGEISAKSATVRESLDQIVGKVREVDTLVSTIALASREQTTGIDQINRSVSEMDKVTQSGAAVSEETAAAAEELNAQSEELRHAVGVLTAMVGGARA